MIILLFCSYCTVLLLYCLWLHNVVLFYCCTACDCIIECFQKMTMCQDLISWSGDQDVRLVYFIKSLSFPPQYEYRCHNTHMPLNKATQIPDKSATFLNNEQRKTPLSSRTTMFHVNRLNSFTLHPQPCSNFPQAQLYDVKWWKNIRCGMPSLHKPPWCWFQCLFNVRITPLFAQAYPHI